MIQVTRRGLIGSLGALFVAPAIVRAESLMKVKPVFTGGAENLWGDEIHVEVGGPEFIIEGLNASGQIVRERIYPGHYSANHFVKVFASIEIVNPLR